ncbi:MAG: DUF2721 domain-containing protein [Sphingomonadaceae bacterium]
MLPMGDQASALSHAIQLAVAPVFLLTAIGGFLSAMTVRLGRIIDRARAVETMLNEHSASHELMVAELATLDRRMALTNRAVNLSVASGLCMCVLIAVLFLAALLPDQLSIELVVPVLFILVMLLLIGGLGSFLLEIRISIHTVRVRSELVAGAPRPPGDFSWRSRP